LIWGGEFVDAKKSTFEPFPVCEGIHVFIYIPENNKYSFIHTYKVWKILRLLLQKMILNGHSRENPANPNFIYRPRRAALITIWIF
jgi:hypothetical protein